MGSCAINRASWYYGLATCVSTEGEKPSPKDVLGAIRIRLPYRHRLAAHTTKKSTAWLGMNRLSDHETTLGDTGQSQAERNG
jgi:hypothetical protein